MEEFDAIIIGTGQSGVPLAGALAGAGWKTAVIEKSNPGGSCINYGCTPTKALIASARTAGIIRNASGYGIKVSSFKIRMREIRKRKDDIVKSSRSSVKKRLEKEKNIYFIKGEASFKDSKTVFIIKNRKEIQITGDKIFINTGAVPFIPEIEGLENIDYLDSTSALDLNEVPEHLAVLGGGYIGLEFAQMFRRFGSKVTIIQRGNRLLSKEDEDISGEIADILTQEGIKIFLNTEIGRVKNAGSAKGGLKKIKIDLKDSVAGSFTATHLLIAAGRKASVVSLNPAAAGIETDEKGFIKVDGMLRTNVEGIYAIGDVKGGPAFTHISYDDFRILKKNLLEGGNETTHGRFVPYTIFIDPQLGRIGITEAEAREKGIDIQVAKMPVSSVARAIETGETRGMMKAIINKKSKELIGCAILAPEGGEIMSMIQIAMMGKLKYQALREGIFAHPLFAESLNNLFSKID